MKTDNLECDLFSLMLNLSQIKDRDKILNLFTDTVNSFPDSFHLRLLGGKEAFSGEKIAIETGKNNFGCFAVEDSFSKAPSARVPLIKSSVHMLAIILENNLQEKLLSDENIRPDHMVQERTAEILKANKNLKSEIDELKKIEERVKDSEKKSRAWLEHSPACTKMLDLDFNLQYMSSAGIKGLKIDDVTRLYGKPYPFDFYPESFRNVMTGNLKEAKKTGEVITQEAPVVDAEGNEMWFHSTIIPVKDDEGKIEYIIILSIDTTERNKTEQALKNSEYILGESQKVANLGSYVLDISSGIWESSPIMDDIFGIDKKDNKDAAYWLQIVHPEDRAMMQDYFETNIIKNHEIFNKEYRIKRINDQEERWVHGLGELIFNDDGDPIRLIGTIQDITERKKAEEALLSEKALSDEYINSLPGLFYVFDDKRFVRWNSEWSKVTGYSDEELAGMYGTDFFEGKDKALIAERMLKVFREGFADAEAEFITKDGRRIPYYITGVRKKLNGKDHLIGLGIDITKRKKAAEALVMSEERFRDFFEGAPIGFHIFGPDRIITNINDAELAMIGYSREEIVGKKKWDDLIIPAQKELFNGHWKDIITKGYVCDLGYTLIHKKGRHVEVLLSASARFDKNKQLINTCGSVINITERKKTEEILKQALQEKDTLLKEVHHRVKNNMMVLYGLMNLQQGALTGKEDIREILENAKQRIQTMGKVHQMLYQSPRLSEIEFSRYVRFVVDEAAKTYGAKKKKISVTFDVDPIQANINVAVPCGLVVNELLTNVFKHAFFEKKHGKVFVSLKRKGDVLELVIKDDGIGMPEGFAFGKGKSLGLRLVSMLTQQIGGHITYKREKGWSIFSVISKKFFNDNGREK